MINIKWHPVLKEEDIEKILLESDRENQLVFKHSNSCGISNIVKKRLEKEAQDEENPKTIHLIDVINERTLSTHIASHIGVRHESPQILLISNGQCIFHTSHFDVSLKNIPANIEE